MQYGTDGHSLTAKQYAAWCLLEPCEQAVRQAERVRQIVAQQHAVTFLLYDISHVLTSADLTFYIIDEKNEIYKNFD
jgi:hypothetical protein